MDFLGIALLILAYPFIAAWIVGAGRTRRLEALESEVAALKAKLDALARSPSTDPAQAAVLRSGIAMPGIAMPGISTPDTPLREASAGQPSMPPGARPDVQAAWMAPPAVAKAAAPDAAAEAGTPSAPPAAPTVPAAPVVPATSVAPAGMPETHAAMSLPAARAPTPLASSAAPAVAPAATPPGISGDASGAAAGTAPDDAGHVTGPMGDRTASGRGAEPPVSPPPRWLLAARDWLFTGNLVAKLGLVILFIGVAFLVKYVAATVTIPIELRLAGVVLADLALLAWGWRLRASHRGIGLPVQGTAIAILMLVVFGAFQRYGLIPAGFAFALLVALTVFTCLLAVLQDAVWLAAFGIVGGFACPLLVATGQGNHIALFSYYALLNAGVLALALKRSWRLLNLLGFVFTFVVGAAWGGLRYTPDHYLSAQLFLILFFLFYVGIALAYAGRRQASLKDYADATLLLGTPLLASSLQAGLVKDQPFGLAFSALALGGFYLALALILRRRADGRWRVVVETFTAIGVVFGTLAIPFAVDGRWTSGAWALEGAGFVWVGLRRRQRLTCMFGLLLQMGAWISFANAATGLDPVAAQHANLWLGFLLLAAGAFLIAANLRKYAAGEAPVVAQLANWSLAVAALWFLAGSWTEAILRLSGAALADWLVAGALLTAVLAYLAGARKGWTMAGALAMAAQLAGAGALLAVGWIGWSGDDTPLAGVAMIAVAALVTAGLIERAPPGQLGKRWGTWFLLWGGAWWYGPLLAIGGDRLASWLPHALVGMAARSLLPYTIGMAASAVACLPLARRLRWPRLRWLAIPCWMMLAGVTAAMLIHLYATRTLPDAGMWLAWAVLLAGAEILLFQHADAGVPLPGRALRALHGVRSGGPWLALWPTGAILVLRWLASPVADSMTLSDDWAIGASWSNYLPTWAMLLALAWLQRRAAADRWPAAPLAGWYRAALIPAGASLVLLLAALWNLTQDGTMAPLPYLPLLNPLDLTTGFALFAWFGAARTTAAHSRFAGADPARLAQRLRVAAALGAYAWFNLILLRSAAHWLGIGYRVEELAASQFVQAMLSLVWSASALVLMRFAARRGMRRTWGAGAVLLGVVVAKLFLVDLDGGGSMARVVSFVGVGLLMLLVGYLAPYPKAAPAGAAPTPSV